jgi:hyperosmotically inducible periplasmic protein
MRVLTAALLLALLTACSDTAPPAQASVNSPRIQAAAPAPKLDPNEELAIRVRRALEDAGKIDAPAIDITAMDGVITLFGTTGSKDELERAGRIAATVDGVRLVENKLVILRGS